MPDGVFEALVLTPEVALLRAEARAVVLRSSDGDLTVLDGHTPLITDVAPGRYQLVVTVNTERSIQEQSFDNNSASVTVQIEAETIRVIP